VYVDAMVLRRRSVIGTLDELIYVMQDASFNVTGLLDAGGVVQERYDYTPFGVPAYLNSSWGSLSGSAYAWKFLYQGGELGKAIGQFSFQHREYNATLGRWLQNDPLIYTSGDLNLYLGNVNNPNSFNDPFGLTSCEEKDKCGPDVNSWFTDELNIHLDYWKGFRGAYDKLANSDKALHAALLQNYLATIPYKWMSINVAGCGTGKCDRTVFLCGVCIHQSKLGDIVYGAAAQLVIEAAKLIVAAAIVKGGTNSVPSLAAILAGISLGATISPNDKMLTKDELCKRLNTSNKNLVNQLNDPDTFTPGKILDMISQQSGDFMKDVSADYKSCEACGKDIGKFPHATFNPVGSTPGDIRRFPHIAVYKPLPIEWPDKIPGLVLKPR
jgi:RHS repeat-associated protein